MGVAVRIALAVLAGAIVMRGGAGPVALQAQDRTTRDKVYSKEQADRGGKEYAALCESCHDPDKLMPGKKAGPVLSGEKFLTKWSGHTLGELHTEILTTMPNDGSAFLDDDQTADILAYMLQVNGFPAGAVALKSNTTSRDVVIVK